MGLEVFVIKDSALCKFLPNSLILEKTDLIQNGFRSNKSYPNQIWKNFIDCVGEKSVSRYRDIIFETPHIITNN